MQIQSVRDPEAFVQALGSSAPAGQLHAIEFEHNAFYLEAPRCEALIAVLDKGEPGVRAVIAAATAETRTLVGEWSQTGCLARLAEALGAPVLELDAAVSLVPVVIPKPWGREVWYTGMEKRGQAGVGDEVRVTPLAWLLSLMPKAFAMGDPESLTLLKVLDPLADEVFGDLYFEMHERKQEVYVVTHVDRRAWPNGEGGIRFGFCPEKRQQYASDENFKTAYAAAVKSYEQARRKIDGKLDQVRQGKGIGLNEPVSPATVSAWLAGVDPALREREKLLRLEMERFTRVLPLKVGDVVKVPCYTPHSLLHGVRTVEFQTPVYERKILAFAQKVLTQPHWDTEEALEKVALEANLPELGAVTRPCPELVCQQVVDFDDFAVWRLSALETCDYPLEGLQDYRLVMAISGEVSLPGKVLAPEQAALVPANARAGLRLQLQKGAVALIARALGGKC